MSAEGVKELMQSQLLCTFTTSPELDNLVEYISKNHAIMFNKIYVFEIDGKEDELVCTYNVDSVNTRSILEKTISLHRKKQSNTLYTINALNALIKSLNNGQLDKKFPINWNDYKNSLLLVNKDSGFIKHDTIIKKIVHLDK